MVQCGRSEPELSASAASARTLRSPTLRCASKAVGLLGTRSTPPVQTLRLLPSQLQAEEGERHTLVSSGAITAARNVASECRAACSLTAVGKAVYRSESLADAVLGSPPYSPIAFTISLGRELRRVPGEAVREAARRPARWSGASRREAKRKTGCVDCLRERTEPGTRAATVRVPRC
jgi:hypothetical protein